MAEAAAGIAIYETVETAAQLGVGAYMVAQPTAPLKAQFTQIATSSEDGTRLSLARSDHTVCIVGSKAYIFGGITSANELAGNEMHCVKLETSDEGGADYTIFPALPDSEGGKIPEPRKRHAACTLGDTVAIYGGTDDVGGTLKESNTVWIFSTYNSTWRPIEVSGSDNQPSARSSAKLFSHLNNLVLYGGRDSVGTMLTDTWHFDRTTKSWTQLPDAPVSTQNATLSDGILYLISGSDSISGDVHFLQLTAKAGEGQSWHTVSFPTTPLTPGPLPRTGACLLPISTGYGRQFLLFGFGAQPPRPGGGSTIEAEVSHDATPAEGFTPAQFWSDMWTYQLPSSNPEVKATTNIYEAIKPAKIKDAIRGALGVDSGKHSWAEVDVLPPADLDESAGKIHPGPRGFFASDVMDNGRCIVIWGGVNPKGEREGDGWMIRLE